MFRTLAFLYTILCGTCLPMTFDITVKTLSFLNLLLFFCFFFHAGCYLNIHNNLVWHYCRLAKNHNDKVADVCSRASAQRRFLCAYSAMAKFCNGALYTVARLYEVSPFCRHTEGVALSLLLRMWSVLYIYHSFATPVITGTDVLSLNLNESVLTQVCLLLHPLWPSLLLVIEEKGVKMKLTVIDTPGFGDHINNENWWALKWLSWLLALANAKVQ